MKTYLLLIASFLVSAAAIAQPHGRHNRGSNQGVPTQVVQRFSASYSNVSNVNWTPRQDLYYVAFEQNRVPKNAVYSPSGDWMYTEMVMSERELPSAIHHRIREDYRGYYVSQAYKVESQREVSFRVRLGNRNGGYAEVEFETGGRVRERYRAPQPVVVYRDDYRDYCDDHCHHHHEHKHKHKHKNKHKGHGKGHHKGHHDCDD